MKHLKVGQIIYKKRNSERSYIGFLGFPFESEPQGQEGEEKKLKLYVEYKVLAVLEGVVLLSDGDNFTSVDNWYTYEELKKEGFTNKKEGSNFNFH